MTSKISSILRAHPERDCSFRIEVDPIASRYKKADEAFHGIANNMLFLQYGMKNLITSVVTKNSKSSENIQVSDLFLGAIMSAYQGKISSEAKSNLAEKIAENIVILPT